MRFLWPQMLWLLVLVPALAAAYLAIDTRRRSGGGLAMVREAAQAAGRWRHLPPALMLAAVGGLLLSAARPSIVVPELARDETVILALDISHSMRAGDVAPTRLAAAQAAAKSFIAQQPRGARIGLVAFAGSASLVQPPTNDRSRLERALDALQTQEATAIGAAIDVALAALPGDAGGVVILLSDGYNTAGSEPAEAAARAAQRGVRVHTVAFGTPNGEVTLGDGEPVRVEVDESTLRAIAEATGARALRAESAPELKRVYQELTATLRIERRPAELTAHFCIAAALAGLLAGGLSVAWTGRIA